MNQEQNAVGTRERLLEVACGLFAEKGYSNASISDLTRLAGANKAAVNYHFGSKENLYREAWRHAHDRLLSQFPPDGGVGDDRPAAERLRGRIRSGLQWAMLGSAIQFRIMRNEMANPTGLLQQVIEDAIRPLRQSTQAILRELLGPAATDIEVELCEVCVVSPWMHITHRRQAEQHRGLAPIFREDLLESMVDHFTTFALAGIQKIRSRIGKAGENGPSGSGNRRRK